MSGLFRLTDKGRDQAPRKPHNVAAWGGIKEVLRLNDGKATQQQIIEVLAICWHPNADFQPNTAYLAYAVKEGWLVEI